MKLYTKTGDKGLTSLYNGLRFPKNSIYFKCLGDLDELNCNIGFTKCLWKEIMNNEQFKVYNGPGVGYAYKTEKCMDTGKYYEWYAFYDILTGIQRNIMTFSSIIATAPNNESNQISTLQFQKTEITDIEKMIDRLDSLCPKIKNFVLPSGNTLICNLHIIRSITRRCERCYLEYILTFIDPCEIIKEKIETIQIYLNRLSDFFFAMSRFITMTLDVQEDLMIFN
jgi:cob(I)alamin adenosyltransferase